MNKSIILLAAAVFLCAGCEKFADTMAARQKLSAAQEAAAKAQAKFEAKLDARVVAVKAAGKSGNAGSALAAMLCSSPKLMEDIEGNMDLLEALSGEGGDRDELKRQFIKFRKRYRTVLEKELPARGATYEEFYQFALGQATAEQKQEFKTLVSEKCPRGDRALVEKTAGGLMHYFTAAVPK
ncbi:MAG: hypothetical protein NTX59_12720 [Elusimicrobia bacterium]|nr:hypothetical protein [Elusimicrobiota bacterium]